MYMDAGNYLDRLKIATDDGRITLSDDSLTINHCGVKRKKSLTSQDINEILHKYFGISGTPR
jgi:arylamine N-acetyltransferase